MIDTSKVTKAELDRAIKALECSTYLMQYCAIHHFNKDECSKCVFKTSRGCAVRGAPFEYKPIRDEQGGAK